MTADPRPQQEQRVPSFIGSGWMGLDEPDKLAEEARAEQREAEDQLNDDIRLVFSSPQGKRVFSWLWQRWASPAKVKTHWSWT